MYPSDGWKKTTEAWQSLVHVCRRWRSLVLGSPRRLNLRLFCTPKTPARDTLDVWPALPLFIASIRDLAPGVENVIAALGQSNRVRSVMLFAHTNWELEKVLATMQVSFPELTNLQLSSFDKTPPAIPDSFLDGSAPRLREFSLSNIIFPGLPKLLLSATRLLHLRLTCIPHSGYISPEAMVALLSVLSNLKTFCLGIKSQLHPDRSLSPPKRSILPTLKKFIFNGLTEYLEDFVTRIDTPQLDDMRITFFNQIDFDCPELIQFIDCTPTLARDKAYLQFDDAFACVTFPSWRRSLEIGILCKVPDQQLSSVVQICDFCLPPPSTVEDLYIERQLEYLKVVWENAYDTIENTLLWLQLLLPFTAVKNLYLSKEFAPIIAAALQMLVGTGITEMLPNLQNIFVGELEASGPFQDNIGQFDAARRLSDHPITISVWDKDSSSKSI